MSEQRHTAGPWRYSYEDWRHRPSLHAHVTGAHSEDEDGNPSCVAVAIVQGNETSQPITEHNARLIAAAPEMYDMLKQMAAVEVRGPIWEYARALIARIDGGE